jgi:flagellar biosynthesis protein FlhB
MVPAAEMSLRELNEEFKQPEGDPAIKGRMKRVRHTSRHAAA